ncbi:MAG: enoyl-CoA hydratase/isomerase family protein [Pirellulales bacterium]|nr:enoyl-CoA hydratase/isomerase family protein [Pirellulales bacterium]
MMFRPSDPIEVKVTDSVGTIVLNRPDHENAITQHMLVQLIEALDDLYRERRVRAIILTGAGEVFSSGMDVREMLGDLQPTESPAMPHEWGDEAASYRDVVLRMMEITKPIIAAVNGPALSGGAGLVAASDIVVASREATFGLPDPRRGLVAGIVAPLLCFRFGTGHVARLLLTSITIDAHQAHRLGIFHELVDADKVWARAMQIADDCAAGAPEAIQLTKRLIFETVGEQLATQLSAGAAMSATVRTTENAQEGMAAYLEQRMPQWK